MLMTAKDVEDAVHDLRNDPRLKVDEQQWTSKGTLFGAESRRMSKTPPWSYKNRLKCKVDPKLFLLRQTGMQSMSKTRAIPIIQKAKLVHAVREADHKKTYAERVVEQAKRQFQMADEDGGGSIIIYSGQSFIIIVIIVITCR